MLPLRSLKRTISPPDESASVDAMIALGLEPRAVAVRLFPAPFLPNGTM